MMIKERGVMPRPEIHHLLIPLVTCRGRLKLSHCENRETHSQPRWRVWTHLLMGLQLFACGFNHWKTRV